jgi:hypothetical protein
MQKPRVWVVEKCPEVRESLREILEGANYKVFVRESPAEATKSLQECGESELPRVVVLGQSYATPAQHSLLECLQKELSRLGVNVSVLVFSTFPVFFPQKEGEPKSTNACILRSVAQMLTLVKGLTRQKTSFAQAGAH